jgi:hypothetical protein
MKAKHWPDGTPRSTGNGFDLVKRRAEGPSIFATPSEAAKAALHQRGVENGRVSRAKRPGPAPGHSHAVMPNLSERATRELKKGGKSISLSTAADTERRQRTRKAAI